MPDAATTFEPHRRRLRGLAYRMLGSLSEAEDIVQDAFLRWHDVDRSAIASPGAYLATIVARLCIDCMTSARARRESYVGTWLPEPVVQTEELAADSATELASELSFALLLTLERLSPLERAAFLLHDVFGMEFGEVAEALQRSDVACRQLAARARDNVHSERTRFAVSRDAGSRLALAFRDAAASGDVAALTRLLANDAVLFTDGGGKRLAALNPIFGRDKIVRFFIGILGKRDDVPTEPLELTWINNQPGFVLHSADGVETMAIETRDEQIVALYATRNPDKLRHLA